MKRLALFAMLALFACEPAPETELPSEPTPEPVIQSLAPASLPAFFDCLREHRHVVVSAHRGGPAPGYAENAIETMAHTLAQGPVFLEIDIAETRDGVLVLMHDDDVFRTTTGAGRVRDLTLAELQALRLKDEGGTALDVHPPTLREALDWAAGKAVLELDVKRGVSYEDVVAAVREADAMSRVVFVTYSLDGAARIARAAPEAMLYVTIVTYHDLDTLRSSGVDLARVVAWTGTDAPHQELYAELAERGVEARFGTLGGHASWDSRFVYEGRDRYAELAALGLAMIATDRPGAAVADLTARDGVEGYGAMQCEAAQ